MDFHIDSSTALYGRSFAVSCAKAQMHQKNAFTIDTLSCRGFEHKVPVKGLEPCQLTNFYANRSQVLFKLAGTQIDSLSACRRLKCCNAAATVIQARWRASHARQHYLRLHAAAVHVQAHVRCRQAQLRYNHMRQAALKIQACWRGRLARQHLARVQVGLEACAAFSLLNNSQETPCLLLSINMRRIHEACDASELSIDHTRNGLALLMYIAK